MKIIMLASMFGLGIFFGSYQQVDNPVTYTSSCTSSDGTYFPEGSTRTINGNTYECVNGRWIRR